MRRSRNKKQLGFTLLEIMVVSSIVGMLATLSMPLWSKSRTTSRTTFCIHNQRKIYDAVSLYELEQRTTLHTIKSNGMQIRNTLVNAGYVNGGYLNKNSYFDCPTSTIQDNDDYQLTYTSTLLTGTTCTLLPTEHLAQ